MSKSENQNSLEITGDAKPTVPVFTCLVYVAKNEQDDGIRAVVGRVANLAGIEASGASERDVLGKLTRAFKSTVLKTLEQGEEVLFLDPPVAKLENEQARSIPVHL